MTLAVTLEFGSNLCLSRGQLCVEFGESLSAAPRVASIDDALDELRDEHALDGRPRDDRAGRTNMTNHATRTQALQQTTTDARHEHRRSKTGTQMRQLLWWLVGGTRGGRNRLRIIRALHERPMNTNQLSNELDLNYKTVQHHLEMLTENGVLTTSGEEYGKLFFLTPAMDDNLDLLDDIAEQTELGDEDA